MVSLEAIREAIVEIDYRVDHLESCISDNHSEIENNDYKIKENDGQIQHNGEFIQYQQHQVKKLQKECRRCERTLNEDRDALVLYCQQFGFSYDMVPACANILTCSDTQLEYRWEYWQTTYYH